MERGCTRLRGWVWVALTCALLGGVARAQTSTTLLLPSAMAYDATGNVYFADTNRNQVLEATLAGGLVVVAGNGVQGFAGDGGAATSAELNAPQGVAVGTDGTIYIADTGNQRIRAVAASGTIATFAGNGVRGFAGDGGAAMAAEFSMPTAIAVDAGGALLMCDSGNQRVRRIAGGVIATIAGNGVQGFAGDGATAAVAELNTPMGVSAAADGRIFIADSRNNRVRVVSAAEMISTFAGTGVAGFAGDGGAATVAELALPRGLVVMPSGVLLIADENNQRVRMVDTSGVISTLQGTGVQGTVNGIAGDGVNALAAMLNSPRAVSVSKFAQPAVMDSANKLMRVEATNASLYEPEGLGAARNSNVVVTAPATAVYGQLSASVTVSGSAGVAQGAVNWLDTGVVAAAGTLNAGTTTTVLPGVGAGVHSLSAAYLGDGLNPAVESAKVSVVVIPAAVVATANAASMPFGTAVPVLTGTLSGVLKQDNGNVAAQFSTTATSLSPLGTYAIGATLTGSASGNYAVALGAGSGSLAVTQATSSVTEQVSAQSYVGFPMVITATVAPQGLGTPTGAVTFLDGANVVASANVVSGVATGTYLAPVAGTHAMTANYIGDANFLPSTSSIVNATVSALPDFSVSVTNPTQSVQGGLIATYNIVVAGQGAFSGAVSLAANGVPTGATVNFAPPQVTPGTGNVTAVLSVQTTVAMASRAQPVSTWWALVLAVPLAMLRRRKRWLTAVACCVVGLAGCGDRSLSVASQSSRSYSFTVTGTGTNLAGAVISHSVVVTMVVE